MGFFDKIKKLNIFAGFSAIDDDFYDELEETLILSDMGMDTTLKAVEELKSRVKSEKLKDKEEVRNCLRRVLQDMLTVGDQGLDLPPALCDPLHRGQWCGQDHHHRQTGRHPESPGEEGPPLCR